MLGKGRSITEREAATAEFGGARGLQVAGRHQFREVVGEERVVPVVTRGPPVHGEARAVPAQLHGSSAAEVRWNDQGAVVCGPGQDPVA